MTVHEPTFNDNGALAMPVLEVAPFARLTIGEESFDVGTIKAGLPNRDADDPREVLAFRQDETSPWYELKNNIEEGWRPVAAEILRNTRDALQDYCRMHMIRRSGALRAGDMASMTLFGFDWDLRVSSDGSRAQVRVGQGGWAEVGKEMVAQHTDLKELAIASLIKFGPNIQDVFNDDVDAWALRLAAGAQVMPIM